VTDPLAQQVLQILTTRIAPEFEIEEIDVDEDLREQLDIDSMDLVQLATALYEVFGIDVPEADRIELTTVTRCVAYLQRSIEGS
jgi:acyl carrier protein